MHVDPSPTTPASPADPQTGPWYKDLTRYHYFVFVVAALGWLFDCMDQRIFLIRRQAALTELLGYQRDADTGLLVRTGEDPLTESQIKSAKDDISYYSGLATMIFMIGWATGGLVFGIMGDRIGRARTMMLTILIYSLFTGLTALSQHWWDFMFYRFLTGLGVGGEFAAGVSLLAEVMPSRVRPFALGLLQALSALGNIAGSLLSWAIFEWRYLFLVGIIPALLVVLIRRGLKEPETWQKARAADLAQDPAAPARALGDLGGMLRDPRWRYHTIIGVLLALAGVIGLWGVGFWTFELVDKVLSLKHTSPAEINRIKSIGTALQDVGAAIGIYVFSLVTARIGRRGAFAGAFLAALAATVLVFGFMERESDVYWMLPLLGFCNLAVFGGYAIYFPELYPTRLRSTGTGFCYNVARYLAALGPFTLGGLVGVYGRMLGGDARPDMPFRYAALTVASIYILGLLVIPFAPETKGKPLPEE